MIYTPWRQRLSDGLQPVQDSLRPDYADTSRCRAYSSWLVPGMIQTRGYIEAIFRTIQSDRGLTDPDVQGAIESRLGRQPLMHADGRQYEFLIEESVLRCGIGGIEVMEEQLRHIDELIVTNSPNIGVLPMGPARRRWPDESFWIFDEERISIELISGSIELNDQADIAEYGNRFDGLAAEAAYGEAARRIVHAAVAALR